MLVPEQISVTAGAFVSWATGYTSTETYSVEIHPTEEVKVTVYVAVCTTFVVFTRISEMVPDPDAVFSIPLCKDLFQVNVTPAVLVMGQVNVAPEQIGVVVVDVNVGSGFTVIGSDVTTPLPQEFSPCTAIFPEIAAGEKLTVMMFVMLLPVAPPGNVQIQEVAPAIGAAVNTMPVSPAQTAVKPLIEVAAGTGVTVMAKVEIGPFPQELVAYTATFPETALVP